MAMCGITVLIGLGIVTFCCKHVVYFYVFLIAKLMDTNF